MAKFNDNIILQGGAEFRNLKITSTVDADIIGVIRSIFNSGGTEVTDIECCADGTNWFSLRGYKTQNTYEEVGGNIPILDGLSSDGKSYKFRVLKAGGEAGSEYISITNNNGIITIDLSNGFKDRIDDIETALLGKVSNEFKTGSESIYKVLSDNNFTDLLLAKLSTIQIKKDVAGNGKYYLAFNDGTTEHQLGADIPLDSVINSGSVKTCTTVDVPVNGYKVGDKYIDFTIANSTEHVYILVSDLIDIMYGFAGDEITTTIESGNKIKAKINSNSIDITKLKKVVLGTITKTNSLISEINEYTLKEAIIVLACNIKDLYDRKADKNQTIISPTADSDQITANTYDLTTILQKSLNNINYLFTNKANSNHNHEGVYLKPADIIDNITSTDINKPLSANQGKVLGALIGERIKGVKVDGIELTPNVNKVVEVPIMQGASASTNGKAGLVPKPLSGQQASFLRGDGSYGQPNADTIASASYIGDVTPVMNGGTFVNNSGNIVITLTTTYVSKTLFPAAVDIVRVIRNGLELAEGEDFTIASGGSNVITLVGYTLYDDDIILVKYKTSIGVYGSVFQNAVDNAIIITSQANEAAQRAEEAAIEAENITDNKIDKSSITDKLGSDKTKVMSQYGVSNAIMKSYLYDRNQLAYGVRQNLAGTGDLERVGNLSLHKTLPISSNARNCVKDATGVKYYLSNTSDFFKEDGVTPSILDGTDGDVMKEVPEFYVLEETVNNYTYTWLSEFPLPGFKRIPKTYHGLYEGSYNTTTGQTRSVINTAANYRLGLPSTGQSRQYYNNGAKLNRNINWTIDRILSNYVRELLFRVDYATYNCQAPYNSQLTAEGYKQGGLGAGVTTLDGRWEWNGYNPFIPCGYTAELGNRTGVKNFTMPYAYEAQNTTTHVNWYKGIYNAATIYNVGEYVADMEDTSIGLGNGKLYKCIQQTTAGTPLTNTAYFTQQTRTVIQVNRYLVEIPFGHIHKHTIDAIVELTENYTIVKCYIYDNPANFADTKTANARYLCDMPATDGYIKSFNKYTSIPSSIGGNSNSWGCDYLNIKNNTSGTLRGLLVSGSAYYGANAGFGCSYSVISPAYASASIGVRLCCIEENIIL